MKFRTTLFALLLLAASCSKTAEPGVHPEAGTLRVTVGSGPRLDIAADTRTALGDDGTTVRWCDGDEIALWALDGAGAEAFSALPFSLWHYNATFGDARFRGDIPQLEAGEYTYLAVSPRPAAVEGTHAAYEIPAVQSGAFDGACDVMVATPVTAQALVEGDNSDAVRFDFAHKVHVLKIRFAENRLAEPVTRLEIAFPQPVAGRLTVDAADAQAAPELTDGSNTLTLRFPEPLEITSESQPVVYAVIAPVDIPADGRITLTAYGAGSQSKPAALEGRLFAEGHTTPLALHIPEADKVYTTLRLHLENTGEETLGERIDSFTLSTDIEGVLFDNGTQSRTFAVTGAGDYDLPFEHFPEALQGQTLTVAYESENALLYRTVTLPATLNEGQVNEVATPLSVPYLLEESFDNVPGFDYNAGNSTSATSSGSSTAKQLSEYGMTEGWSGARCGVEAGKAMRICCRNEYAGSFGIYVHGTYHGRVDSPALTGIRDGKSPNIRITFNYAFNRACNTGGTNQPYLAFGVTDDENRNTVGTSSPGSEYYTWNIPGALLTDLTGELSGSFDNIPLGGESAPLRIEGAVNTQRLVWEVYMKDKETGSGFTRNTMSNNWVYIDNIRVSIDK